MSAAPTPIEELIPKTPAALSSILARAMAKDPADRYQSAIEMAQALAAARQSISPVLDAATLSLRTSTAPSPPPTALRTSQIQGMIADEVAKRQKRGTWRRVGLATVAVGATVLYLKPWDRSPAGDADTGAQTAITAPPTNPSDQTQAPPPDTTPSTVAASSRGNSGAPGEGRQTTPASGGSTGRQTSGERTTQPPPTQLPPPRDAAAEAAAQQAAALMTTARGFATDARRNAQTAGATATDLSDGDRAVGRAEGFARDGRNADAAQQYQSATQAFNDAANTARNRAAEAARAQANVPPPRTDSVVPPPAPVDQRPRIQQVIDSYSRAIAAEDTTGILRVFPAIPDGTRRAFIALFGVADRLRSTYTVRDITISGTTATASFSGVYEFYNSSTRRDDTQRFQGTIRLARDGDTWRITGVQ
jgi:serine/threonine-protein kinase